MTEWFKDAELDPLRDRLSPVVLGYEAGQQDLPGLEADQDPHEHPIVDAIENLQREAHSSLSDRLHEAHKHFEEIQDSDWRGDINRAERDAIARLDQVEGMRSLDLHHKRVEAGKRVEDLAKFRAENGLSRSPTYPDVGWSVFLWGLVAFLFVVESFANSVWLAKGNELGLLGAYTVAFVVSLANLLPPFLFFGPVSRYLRHVSASWRVLAGSCIVVYAGLLFTLNLGVAHYREVSGELIGSAGVEVVGRMTDAPFGLQDAESWLLLLMGIIFSLVALYEGWKRDDAYPGYGKLDRVAQRARDAHLDARNDASEDLAEIREEALDRIKRIAHEAEKRPRERLRVLKDCERWVREFDSHVDRLQQGGAALIEEYREANRKARSDGGVPLVHRTPWRLLRLQVENPLSTADVDPLTEARIQEIQEHDQQATNRISEHYDAVQTRLLRTAPPQPTAGIHTAAVAGTTG